MPYTPRPEILDVDTRPRPLPPSLFGVTCADTFGWWIECVCTASGCCGSLVDYPLRLLILRHSCGERRLLDVAARLRCKRCHAKPSSLTLTDDPTRRVSGMRTKPPGGGPAATVINLLPLLAA